MISAIKYPFSVIFSKTKSSEVLFNDLINDIKLLISMDFVEISKFSIENFLSIKDFKEIRVFILSISIVLFLFLILGPMVLTFTLNLMFI